LWHGELSAGDDAVEVGWFAVDEIPELAFKVHEQVLDTFFRRGSIR
jgi:hypothetical protein